MKKAKIRNRYNQVPYLTQDTVLESDKKTRKHHKQEESQEVNPSQQVITRIQETDVKVRNRQIQITYKDPQKKFKRCFMFI